MTAVKKQKAREQKIRRGVGPGASGPNKRTSRRTKKPLPANGRATVRAVPYRPHTSVSPAATTIDSVFDNLNLLEFLAGILDWPLSLLAVLAQYDGLISGSQAVEAWFCGYGSETESDLDVYVLHFLQAVGDVSSVLSHAGVEWNNILLQKFEELETNGKIALPCAMIVSLVNLLLENNWTVKDLERYLNERFKRCSTIDFEKTAHIRLQFYNVVESCHDFMEGKPWTIDHAEVWKEPENYLWILDIDPATPPWLAKLDDQVQDIVDHVIELLGSCPRNKKGNLKRGEATKRLQDKFSRRKIKKLKERCNDAGITEKMLYDYLSYTVAADNPHEPKIGKNFLISKLLRIKNRPAPGYGGDLRILRGELPSGKKVQIIIDSANRKSPLYTVLQFYATHIMCWIGGTLAAHLYYETAKPLKNETAVHLKSLVLDFSMDRRQKVAKIAMEKYIRRGWNFEEMNRDKLYSRTTCDQHTKMVDFEDLYTKALQSVKGTSATLPCSIKKFLLEKSNQFRSLTWREEFGRIPKSEIRYKAPRKNTTERRWSTRSKTPFSDWVHQDLDGHKHVIPKSEWEKHDTMRTALDMWFGGVWQALVH